MGDGDSSLRGFVQTRKRRNNYDKIAHEENSQRIPHRRLDRRPKRTTRRAGAEGLFPRRNVRLDARDHGESPRGPERRPRRTRLRGRCAVSRRTSLRRAKTLHEIMQDERVIGLLWNIDDVRSLRPDLTDDQAWSVLQHVDDRKDATLGITWDTLSWAADDLFPYEEEVLAEGGAP